MYIRVLIYDDNEDLRDSLSILLKGTIGFDVVGAFSDCRNIKNEVLNLIPDVVLMDIDMPYANGIEGLKVIKEIKPEINVLILTIFDDNKHIFEAICSGATGYLLKGTTPAKIIEGIIEVYNGGAPMTASVARQTLQFFATQKQTPDIFLLTERERETLQLLVKGYSYKMIADVSHLSIDAVRSRIKKIYDKLHVHTMSEAVVKAIRERLVD